MKHITNTEEIIKEISKYSHDIKNTIASTHAFMHLLHRKVGPNADPSIQEYMQKIDEKIQTMTQQVNDMSSFCKRQIELNLPDGSNQ